MQLLRLRRADQSGFDTITEVAMDLHFAQSHREELYLVIGGRVSILRNEKTFAEPGDGIIGQAWMSRGIGSQERAGAFENWLWRLDEAPTLTSATPVQAWLSFWNAFSPVTPTIPLPPPPPRPSWIYGHLPFSTTTYPETIIYRW